MIIPKAFSIGRRLYKVHSVKALKHPPRYGTCYPSAGDVQVAQQYMDKDRTERQQAESFWHEVTHCILHDMGHPLRSNERFVKDFSQRLNQVVHTAKLE